MHATIELPSGNHCTVRFDAADVGRGHDLSLCRFENRPSARDWATLELLSQVLFRNLFRYRKEADRPVWFREHSIEEPAAEKA